jgi:hypothetical protein
MPIRRAALVLQLLSLTNAIVLSVFNVAIDAEGRVWVDIPRSNPRVVQQNSRRSLAGAVC